MTGPCKRCIYRNLFPHISPQVWSVYYSSFFSNPSKGTNSYFLSLSFCNPISRLLTSQFWVLFYLGLARRFRKSRICLVMDSDFPPLPHDHVAISNERFLSDLDCFFLAARRDASVILSAPIIIWVSRHTVRCRRFPSIVSGFFLEIFFSRIFFSKVWKSVPYIRLSCPVCSGSGAVDVTARLLLGTDPLPECLARQTFLYVVTPWWNSHFQKNSHATSVFEWIANSGTPRKRGGLSVPQFFHSAWLVVIFYRPPWGPTCVIFIVILIHIGRHHVPPDRCGCIHGKSHLIKDIWLRTQGAGWKSDIQVQVSLIYLCKLSFPAVLGVFFSSKMSSFEHQLLWP